MSKLAQDGDNNTTSPGEAPCAAQSTASRRVAASVIVTTPSQARCISGAASPTNLLTNPGHRRDDLVAFEVGPPIHACADRRGSCKSEPFCAHLLSQRCHTLIVKVEQGKVRRDLILEDSLFRRDIFIQRVIP